MMARAQPKVGLRPLLPADAPLLAAIFAASILELTSDDYTEAQQEAWAAVAEDEDAFAARLARETTLVASLSGEPAGFASLKANDHIDMLYVHPEAIGQGVATVLIDALERLAAGRGAGKLTVDASDTALGFFQRRGYSPQQRNTVTVGDEWLANTTMQKQLAPVTPAKGVQ